MLFCQQAVSAEVACFNYSTLMFSPSLCQPEYYGPVHLPYLSPYVPGDFSQMQHFKRKSILWCSAFDIF